MGDFADEFQEQGGASAPPITLQNLESKLAEAVDLQEAVDSLEDSLKAARKALHVLRTSVIPEMMAEASMEKIAFRGYEISVGDFVSGSLPKDPEKRKAALDWLTENGGAGLIKTEISLQFGKGEGNVAGSLAQELRDRDLSPVVDRGVHASTLKSFALERLRSGAEIDHEALGLFIGQVAKIARKR